MKLIFKNLIILYIIFLAPHLFSREVILIENIASIKEGELLRSILTKKFHLPYELITLKNINNACETKSEALIHLCLEANGELVIKKMNQYIVKNSLGVFLNQIDEQGDKK